MTPDLIVLADTIHTLDDRPDNGSRPAIQAVAVSDGLIAAVGTREDAQEWRQPGTRVVDLGRATLTPGLVDCHIHPVFGLDLTIGCDLSSASTLAEVRALLQAEKVVRDTIWAHRGWRRLRIDRGQLVEVSAATEQ